MSPTLCIDAGNTRLKWGLRLGGEWLAVGTLAHEDTDGLPAALPQMPAQIVACNVAGPRAEERIIELGRATGAALRWFTSSEQACGVTNGYERPERLGADRWAALIGAHSLHPGAALVVMAGTATTIDVLDAAGRFRGGLILPGLDLMRSALAQNTAGLPQARGSYRDMPANTDDAITSGTLHATLGAIERMAARCEKENFCCLLSGGAAAALQPHLEVPLRQVEHLVLEGLARTIW